MPTNTLSRFLALPELRLLESRKIGPSRFLLVLEKETSWEVCRRCPNKASTIYDRRTVTIKDEPIRGNGITLEIRKRRFRCSYCKHIFTEIVPGINPRARLTERFKKGVLWACETFADMKKVKRVYRCSNNTLYKLRYQELARKEKEMAYQEWPVNIGLDEHKWKRNKEFMRAQFVTMLVDHKRKRAIEVVEGKSTYELKHSLAHIKGRENVKNVTMDLCDPFAAFIRDFFPQAAIVADKFHVLRLLNPHLNRRRKEITGDKRTHPLRKLLLRNGTRLDFFTRTTLHRWLDSYPELKDIYHYKERLYNLYRIKGYDRAKKAHSVLVEDMKTSVVPEIQTFRKTLIKWREPILNYFKTGLTNARLEGFNNVAKTVKKRAYGIRSFKNYRLLLKNACRSRT